MAARAKKLIHAIKILHAFILRASLLLVNIWVDTAGTIS
jgi:hypothetical protein